jgi:hypothetical protein
VTARLTAGAGRAADEHCITCGDEGIAMSVVQCEAATAMCRDRDDGWHEVAIELVAPVAAGDEVLVHAGVAIRRLKDGT